MKHLLCKMLAVCVLGVIFGVPVAMAESGRITFSGAIVEPTCSISNAEATASQTPPHDRDSPRRSCGDSNTVANSSQSYALVTVRLDSADTGSDPLLHYFAGYANVIGEDGVAPKLVVRTYQ